MHNNAANNKMLTFRWESVSVSSPVHWLFVLKASIMRKTQVTIFKTQNTIERNFCDDNQVTFRFDITKCKYLCSGPASESQNSINFAIQEPSKQFLQADVTWVTFFTVQGLDFQGIQLAQTLYKALRFIQCQEDDTTHKFMLLYTSLQTAP
eukprot:m.403476 g.403476  ORF g.403476 m.403476 type:complete len:151 (-) comp21193_c1_seq6:208-660(-)